MNVGLFIQAYNRYISYSALSTTKIVIYLMAKRFAEKMCLPWKFSSPYQWGFPINSISSIH